MALKTIATSLAPAAIGPYSQAMAHGNTLYVSGCIGLLPKTMTLADGLAQQTTQALENMKAVLAEGGSSFDRVLKVTVYLRSMSDFATCNEIYAKYFPNKPARACVAAADLPKGALFELDAVAAIGDTPLATIATPKAAAAIGPYSQAVKYGNTLYVSGCIGLDSSLSLVEGLEAQTVQALENLKAVLEAGGSSMSQVLKTTVYLTTMSNFAACNKIYEKYFGNHKPARACVAAKELPKGSLFELDAVAAVAQAHL